MAVSRRLILIAAMLIASTTVLAEPKSYMKQDKSDELGVLIEYGSATNAVDGSKMQDPCKNIGLERVVDSVFASHGLKQRESLEPLFIWIDCKCFRMQGASGPLTYWIQIYYATRLHDGKPVFNMMPDYGVNGVGESSEVLGAVQLATEMAISDYLQANMETAESPDPPSSPSLSQ